jgi:hypothetical protein
VKDLSRITCTDRCSHNPRSPDKSLMHSGDRNLPENKNRTNLIFEKLFVSRVLIQRLNPPYGICSPFDSTGFPPHLFRPWGLSQALEPVSFP